MKLKPHITTPENAEKIGDWLRTRGGIAIWTSADFNRLGQSLTTPATTAGGQPYPKPAWWTSTSPACIITDPADVLVAKDLPIKRFRVGLRQGDNSMQIKCTPGASRRIRTEVAKAGDGAFHVFDYSTQEAVIMKPESQVSLSEFLKARG
jgi:hypothetical protein